MLKKSLLIITLLSLSLMAVELSEAEIAAKQEKLVKAEKQAAEAKIELKAAQDKLAAAQKIIKKKEIALPLNEGGKVVHSNHTELSYVKTTGNTDTTTGSIDFMQKAQWGVNTLKLDFDYLYGEEDKVENNNKLETMLNYDLGLNKYIALNYLVGYKDDKFSGFEYQFFTGPGIKYILIQNDVHNLETQVNIVYSKDVEMDKFFDVAGDEIKYPYADPAKDPLGHKEDGKINEYGAFFTKADYTWKITDNFKFIQMLSYRVDLEDSDIYFVNSKSALESKISDIFSMGVNYKITYVNAPPEGNRHTDKVFSVSLIMDF
ncbi:MAG: hypothetical protein COA44_02540 [Arcobacter sp.]|nr:MAG: hypothetical protein COA44_02540 [Arcobacter sp.]